MASAGRLRVLRRTLRLSDRGLSLDAISPGLDDGLLIALASGEVYSFDLFVDENWRGRRIFAALVSRSRLFFKEQGYTTVYSRVSVFNRSSRKAMRRGGWKVSGLVLRARGGRRGGWPIVTLSGSAHPVMRR